MSKSRPLLIFGARIFAEEIADLAAGVLDAELVGFVENLDRDHPKELAGLPVFWIDEIAALASTHDAICALGTTQRRKLIQQAEDMGFHFRTLIDPSARVFPSARIAPGAIVGAHCVVAAQAEIGPHTILNRGVLVGHHTRIGSYSTISPGANIAGKCHIGNQVWVGMGAIVTDRIEVGSGSVLAAGCLVTKNVPERTFAAGSPARFLKSSIEPK